MRSPLPLLPLLLAACGTDDPYASGGAWLEAVPSRPCVTDADVADSLGTDVLDVLATFSLYDQYAYQLRLQDLCAPTVLLTLGAMGASDDGVLDGLDVAAGALYSPNVDDVLAVTTWFVDQDGQIPTVGALRRQADALGIDTSTARRDGLKVAVVRDGPRFENAAAAASVQWAATDSPELPLPAFRQERELAGRWNLRRAPFYVVLHPPRRIVACGTDLQADRIIEAVETDPDLWTHMPDPDGRTCQDKARE